MDSMVQINKSGTVNNSSGTQNEVKVKSDAQMSIVNKPGEPQGTTTFLTSVYDSEDSVKSKPPLSH